MRKSSGLLLAAFVLIPLLALGHVSVTSGPQIANATQEIPFGIGHGCEGADTSAVTMTIPDGVTSVRAVDTSFGRATVTTNSAGVATSVTWQRRPGDLSRVDTNTYKMPLRVKLPNRPFEILYFPAVQTCIASDGGTLMTEWTNTSGVTPGPNDPEPAPLVAMVPAHKVGWNKFSVPVAVDNLALFFSDAQIVWKGTAAFSPNASVTELIAATQGVTALSALQAGDEIWVKY